jgi:hypothetical protein
MSLSLLISSLLLFGVIAIAAEVLAGVVVLGTLTFNISHKALVFAVVFSFCHWYQNKRQLPMLLLFLAVFGLALLDAMVLSRGRRLMLSVAVAPLICMYWLHWRYLPPKRNLIRLGAATLIAFAVAGLYNSFRHYNKTAEGEGRSFGATVTAMKGVHVGETFQYIKNNPFFFLAQYCGHYSLLTIHLLENKQLEVEPLHSLRFIVLYPIPRAFFPTKPQLLGLTIVRDVLRLPYQTNWGIGIAGTGYHEGGIPTIILYALIIVLVCRLIDDALVRQPSNPFLIAVLSTSAPHFAAMIRGDYCIMLIEVGEAVLFAWALGLLARFMFGTAPAPEPRGLAPQAKPPLGGQFRHAGR